MTGRTVKTEGIRNTIAVPPSDFAPGLLLALQALAQAHGVALSSVALNLREGW